jgi:hypothetical protein
MTRLGTGEEPGLNEGRADRSAVSAKITRLDEWPIFIRWEWISAKR